MLGLTKSSRTTEHGQLKSILLIGCMTWLSTTVSPIETPKIIDVTAAEVRINRGSDNGIHAGMEGSILTTETIAGQQRMLRIAAFVVFEVNPGDCRARVIKRMKGYQIAVGNPVEFKSAPEPVGYLMVTTSPPGATVSIDGKERGITPLRLKLPVGEHRLDASLPGYQDVHSRFYLRDRETAEQVLNLEPMPPPRYQLALASFPPEAEVYVDDIHRGRSPVQLELSGKNHRLRLIKDGYRQMETELNLSSAMERREYTLQKSRFRLTVTVKPSSASVWIDDRQVGNGFFSDEMELGNHRLMIKMVGFHDVSETVVIADSNVNKSYELEAVRSGLRQVSFTFKLDGGLFLPASKAVSGDYGSGLQWTLELGGRFKSFWAWIALNSWEKTGHPFPTIDTMKLRLQGVAIGLRYLVAAKSGWNPYLGLGVMLRKVRERIDFQNHSIADFSGSGFGPLFEAGMTFRILRSVWGAGGVSYAICSADPYSDAEAISIGGLVVAIGLLLTI